mmetsp:Transcript_12159/g.41151  ORF Transcript_12159/g.41151 Transcript_12159/m.41151 type:complete len:233 (+) Transcript_12159:320-1018(+)
MGWGVRWLSKFPCPSLPPSPRPEASTSPSSVRSSVCVPPAEAMTTRLSPRLASGSGLLRLRSSPRPRRPSSPRPHDRALPLRVSTTVCQPPQATDTASSPSGSSMRMGRYTPSLRFWLAPAPSMPKSSFPQAQAVASSMTAAVWKAPQLSPTARAPPKPDCTRWGHATPSVPLASSYASSTAVWPLSARPQHHTLPSAEATAPVCMPPHDRCDARNGVGAAGGPSGAGRTGG